MHVAEANSLAETAPGPIAARFQGHCCSRYSVRMASSPVAPTTALAHAARINRDLRLKKSGK
jgi:hypothetical protein